MTALAAAQASFEPIEKACTATVASRREGARSFSYRYASLADVLQVVRPVLARNGLAVLQMASVTRGAVVVTTLLAHSSGEWIETRLAIGLESTDPQAVGSAMSYGRRYSLCALVGVDPGDADDDAAAAMPATSAPTAGAPESPDGFDAFWVGLHTAASQGLPALEQAWREASGAHKQHVVTAHKEAWTALKQHAQSGNGHGSLR